MFWKIYAWAFLLLNVVSFVYFFADAAPLEHERLGRLGWLDVPISLVAVVGVLGYAHHRQIATQEFWCAWLVLTFSWDVLYHSGLVLFWTGPEVEESWVEVATTGLSIFVLSLPLALPAYIALILYCHRWSRLRVGLQQTA